MFRRPEVRTCPVVAFAVALLAGWMWGPASAAVPAPYEWESHLRASAIVLLGEVHDNGGQHRRRLAVLERAVAAGWRPALAMEQFDRDYQGDIDRARREHPGDADYLIAQAALAHSDSGWDWKLYRPFIALALRYDLPIIAANLSRADATRVFSQGYTALFGDATVESLKLNHAPAALLAAQAHEIDLGHCHTMPAGMLPAMAQAQIARDAVMANLLLEHSADGIVLLAGNGHVRRDLGVVNWLEPAMAARVFSVGFLERGDQLPPGAFDATVVTDRAPRSDPCRSLRKRHLSG
jgi:uncharacterized iron-regulated protein